MKISIEASIRECDCCGYKTYTTRSELTTEYGRNDFYLCEICSSTHLSKALTFPSRVSDQSLFKSIGWIANRLIKEIRKVPLT